MTAVDPAVAEDREALELGLREWLDDDDAVSAAQYVIGAGWQSPAEVAAGRAEERSAERGRLADLFLLHRETLAGFAGDKDDLMRLLAHLMRLRQEVGR